LINGTFSEFGKEIDQSHTKEQPMAMVEDEFRSDLRLIVDLEDELNRVHPHQCEQQWVIDRINNLRFLYQHLERVWWPLVPGRGTQVEGKCNADNQSEE
jgi:hypothetical protein